MPFVIDSLAPEITIRSEVFDTDTETKQDLAWTFERLPFEDSKNLFMEINTFKKKAEDEFKRLLKCVSGAKNPDKSDIPHSDELVDKLLQITEVRVPALLKFQDMLTGKYVREEMEKNS